MTVTTTEHLPVPGTIHLVDVQHTLGLKHASGTNKDVVLVPRPTNDPEDPLNWTKRRKLLSVFSMSVYMLMTGISSSLMYSIIVPVSRDTGLSVAGTFFSLISHQSSANIFPRSQRWHRVLILVIRLGLSDMATSSFAIWKTTNLSSLVAMFHCCYDFCALCTLTWTLDGNESTSWFRRRPTGIFRRNLYCRRFLHP